jgi:photosystem II stability/assembly factor-like uncharacterized protein
MTGLRTESTRTEKSQRIFSHYRSRKLFVLLLAGVSLIVVGGSIAAATVGKTNQGPASFTGNADDPVSPSAGAWTVPANETDAPIVSTPGGASVSDGNFNAVSCQTANNCVAVGGDNNLVGVIATSTDGGSSWSQSSVASGEPELNAVTCSSSTTCVAVGNGAAVTSSDGGTTWTTNAIPTLNTTLLGVSCPSSTTCVSVGVSPGNDGPYDGQLLYSSDGGSTWTMPTLPNNVGALGSVDCPSATFCVAVGAQILVSNDGGQTWTAQFVDGGTGILRSVSCSSSTDCVAIGANPLGATDAQTAAFGIVTTDAGASWNPITMPSSSWSVDAISCANGLDCTIGGLSINSSTAPAWASTDGGQTWSSVSLPPEVSTIGAVSCQSESQCVIVGLQGSQPVSGSSQGAQWTISPVPSVFSSAAASL